MAKTAEEILQEARNGKYIFSNNNKSKKSASDIKKNAEKYTVNVSDNYIKRFVTDSQQFLNNASREYSNVGYSGKDVAKKSVLAEKSDLDNRCNLIKAYYNANKNNIGKEPYTQMMSYLDSYDDSSNKVANAYIELASKGLKDFGTPYVEYVDEKELHKTQTLKGKTLSVPGATLNNPLKVSKNSSTFGELEAYKHISNYDAKTVTSKQIDDDIKRLESYKAGANRRGKTENIDRYDATITKLSDYKYNFLNDNGTDKRNVDNRKDAYSAIVTEIEGLKNKRASGTSGLDNRINELETIRNLYERSGLKTYDDYYNIETNDDYDVVSKQRKFVNPSFQEINDYSTRIDNGFTEKYDSNGNVYYVDAFGDVLDDTYYQRHTQPVVTDSYAFYTGLTDEEKEHLLTNTYISGENVDTYKNIILSGDKNNWSLLEPEEVSKYYYVLNTEGKEAADSYLENMSIITNKKNFDNRMKKAEKRAIEQPILANLASVPTGVVGGVVSGVSDGYEMLTDDYSPYDNSNIMLADSQKVREKTASNIDKKTDGANLLGFSVGDTYQALMSGADSMFAGALGVAVTKDVKSGSRFAAGALSMAAGSARARELYEQGENIGTIATEATIAAAAEYVFEQISLEKLFTKKGSKFLARVLKQARVEGYEEICTEIVNISADVVLRGDKSDVAQQAQVYMLEKGWSANVALALAVVSRIYEAGMGGLVAGSGSAAVVNAPSLSAEIKQNRQNKKYGANITEANNVNALVDSALSLPNTSENAEIIGLAKKIKSTGATKSSDLASKRFNKQVGKLYSLLQERNADLVFGAESIATKEAIREELVGLGVTESLDATVDAVYSELNGDKLSKKENALINTEQAQAVLKTIRNSSDVILNRAAEKQLEGIHNTYKTKRYLDNTNVEKSSDTEIDIEDYTQSDDGKTYIADTAQAVEVGDIKSVTKNDVVVELADGSTKSVKELSLGNKDSAVLYQGVVDIQNYMGVELSPYIANSIFNGYHESFGTAGEYISDVKSALAKGYISDNSKLTAYGLPQSVMQSYYDVGQALREAEVQKAKSKLNNSNYKTKSKVKFEGFDKSQLTARQQVGVAVVTYLADKLGYNVVFFESKRSAKTKSGFTSKYGEVNGQFDRDTNTMYIDVNAGMNGKGTILFTAAHELTHYFAKNSPEDFKAFSDFLVSEYIKHGVDVDELVKDRMQSQKLSYNEAFEEVIADSCERFLADGNLTQQVEKLSETNKSLAQKIKKLLSDLLAKVKEIYSRLSADSEESKIVSQMSDTLSDIMDKWSQGIINASKNADTVTGKSQTKNTATEDGVKHFSRENSSSLREQIIENIDLLNNMDIVAWVNSDFEFTTKQEARDWAVEQLEEYGDIINRSGFGNVILDSKRIKNGFRYLKNENEIIAFATVPQIIMKGIKIGEHSNHKNRLYNTVTFAGPVSINGTRGNVAVVVRMADNNYYKMHRLVLPDGTQFVFDIKKEDTTERAGGVNENSGLSPTDDVSTSIIPDSTEKSNSNSKKSSQRLIADTVEHFGTTYSWKETGYLLTDGRKLDFSGRKFGSNARYRTIDHREIWDGFSEEDQEQFESGSEAMVHFMQQGNIRIMPESDGINLSVAPTKAQESALSDYITRANGEILLDIDDLQGNTKVSVEYPSGTKTSKIINDIRQYFADGTEPYVSSIQEFRYSRRYTDIDLNTLDDNELKVYNNRGWASGLFTDEEHKLLQEKFNELNTRTRQKTDNVLGDGTRVVEVNNKLVLISGPFEAPIIHNVLVINANNETEAEIYKEIIYYEQEDHKRNKSEYSYGLQLSENIIGSQFVRNYESADFSYHKGRKDTGERALLPDSFKSYGYTKQFTERTGSNTETETYLSAYNQIGEKLYQTRLDFDGETKYQPRPSIDDFLFDDEYSELTDNDAYLIGQYITGDALTVNHLINNTRKTELSDSALNRIVSKLVKSYNLDSSNNKDISIALLSLLDSKNISDVKANMELISSTFEKVIKNTTFATEDDIALKEDLSEYLNDFRKKNSVYLTDDQVSSLEFQGRSVGWLKNQLFGKLNVVKKNSDTKSRKVDFATFYYDLAQEFPQVFSAEDSDAVDNWETFLEKVDRIYHPQDAGVEYAFGKSQNNLAGELTGRLIADVVEKKYNNRKNGYVDTLVRKLHREHNEKVKKAKAETRRKVQEAEKKKYDKLVEKHKQERKNLTERRNKTELRGKIRKLTDSFKSRLLHPTQNKYVPRELVSQTIDVLNAINLDSGRSEKLTEKIASLRTVYDAMKNDASYYAAYDDTVSNMMLHLTDILGNTSITNMSFRQLQYTYDTLKALDTVVCESVKLTDTEYKQSTHEFGRTLIQEIRDIPKSHDSLLDKYLTMMTSPESFFDTIAGFKKDSNSSKLYRMLNDGQLKTTRMEMEFYQLFDELLADRKSLKTLINTKELVDIGLSDDEGNKIQITRGMMLSLYMHLTNQQNANHIQRGGLTVPDIASYYKGDMDKAFGTKQESARGISLLTSKLNHQLSELEDELEEAKDDPKKTKDIQNKIDDVKTKLENAKSQGEQYISGLRGAIESQLTEYEKQWLSTAHYFFDTVTKRELNDTTYKLYGYAKATVKNYYPIHTDSNYRAASFENIVRDLSLENSGMMKSRTMGASNPILLEDITDVITTYIDRVSTYCGMTIPIKNFQKVYGTTKAGFETSVQRELSLKFSKIATNYIDDLLTDLTAGRKGSTDFISKTLDKARGSLAHATLSVNLRVAIAQAASYPTAAAEIGWKPLIKALAKGGKNGSVISRADKELIAKWSPLLYKRMQGYSTTEIGDLKSERSKRIVAEKKMRWLLGWIQAVDGATVGRLWYAAEYYVQDNKTDLKKGTDTYYEEVAKVFNNIVERTQPNYATMQRPDLLRNPNSLLKTMTMFMTQRLQNFNIVYRSVGKYNKMLKDYKSGKNEVTVQDVKDAKIDLNRAVSSQAVAAVTIVAMKALSDILMHSLNGYRDDDDELTAESVSLTLLDNLIDTIVGCVFLGSDMYSLSKVLWNKWFGDGKDYYYGMSLNGVETFAEIADSIVDFSGEPNLENFNNLAKSVCQLTGIPLTNVEKIATGLYYWYVDIANGDFLKFEAGTNRSISQNINRYNTAYEKGNTTETQLIVDEIVQEKYDEYYIQGYTKEEAKKKAISSVKSSFGNYYKDVYLNYLFVEKNANKANQIKRVLYSTGLWSKLADIDKLCQGWREGYLEKQDREKQAESRK